MGETSQNMEGAQSLGATTPTPAAAAGNMLQSTVGVRPPICLSGTLCTLLIWHLCMGVFMHSSSATGEHISSKAVLRCPCTKQSPCSAKFLRTCEPYVARFLAVPDKHGRCIIGGEDTYERIQRTEVDDDMIAEDPGRRLLPSQQAPGG